MTQASKKKDERKAKEERKTRNEQTEAKKHQVLRNLGLLRAYPEFFKDVLSVRTP